MAKKVYIGESNLSKKIDEIYLGINGKARKVTKAYIGVNGAARQFWPELILYYWNKYNSNALNTYYWNRYNRVTTYRYYWDRYNVNETTIYNWNRYYIENQTIYIWNKYNQTFYESLVNRLILQSSASSTFTNNSGSNIKYWTTTVTRGRYEVNFSDDGKIEGVTYNNRPLSARYMYPGDTLQASEDYITILEAGESINITRDGKKFSINSIGNNIGTHYIQLYGTDHYTSEGDPGTGYYYYEIAGKKGSYAGEYSSTDRDAKPDDGFDSDGYYYEYYDERIEQTKGVYVGSISSESESTYPQDGIQNNYWYTYTGTSIEYSRGSANGSVNSTNRFAYPEDGKLGNYWYVYDRQTTEYSQGSYINQVSSTNRGAYPDNNYSGSYWYVYDHVNTTYSRGSYIGAVQSENPSAYPSNGRHTDGYWYVKQ